MAMLIGSLALIGFPGFSGFFSKDSILLALGESDRFGATFAYVLLMAGVFVTAFYSFRMFFIVFHGEESEYVRTHEMKESPWVVTLPLILLSIPAVLMGLPMIEPMLNGTYFNESIFVTAQNDTMMAVYNNYYHGVLDMIVHSFMTLPVALALSGVLLAWILYIKRPDIPGKLKSMCPRGYYMLDNAYGFDRLNEIVFVNGTRKLGQFFTKSVDIKLIDTGVIMNTCYAILNSANSLREAQTGYLYHYAFVMIFGLLAMLVWVLW
jgi:NADH-quinone oxidoreductase subunit L